MSRLVLTEYATSELTLDASDAEFLNARFSRQFTVRRRVDGTLTINPNQFVGVVRLPSGVTLEVQPKIPVRNLFQMLALTLNLELLPETVEYDELDELLEFVVRHFLDLVEARVERGLHRDYIEREDNLPLVRGRIAFPQDIRSNWAMRHHTFCRYSDLTWDIPDNQLILQTVQWLAGWGLSFGSMTRLGRLGALMEEVTPSRFRPSDVGGFSYHRMNTDYEPIHELCRLFLEGASINESTGEFEFRAFLVDMNDLFERFLSVLAEWYAPAGWVVQTQQPSYLATGHRVAIRPDLVGRRFGRARLIADCKYKRISAAEYRNHDLYQVLAYCVAWVVDHGALIYPRHEVLVEDELAIQNSDVAIRIIAIDLGLPWVEVLRHSAAAIKSLLDWASPKRDDRCSRRRNGPGRPHSGRSSTPSVQLGGSITDSHRD